MKVSAYMTSKVIVAHPEDGIRHTFFEMRRHRIRHLPVVDKDGRLMGIISDRDLRRPDWVDEAVDIEHVYTLDDSLSVRDLMTTNLLTVRTSDSVDKAAKLFLEHGFGALPVLNKQGSLVGVLSSQDLLRALVQLMELHPTKNKP